MKYIKKTLENGMTIVLVPMKTTNIITMGFFVKVGSKNESADTSGLSHFLEHMMFKGTSNRPDTEVFRQLDMIGASYNATTTMENTYYYMLGNSSDTKKILDIVLDIYINPTFDTKLINKERKVVIEEMRMRSDNPYSKLYKEVHKKLFKSTPLARAIDGTEDNIRGFTKKDFVKFRTESYRPNNTVFVVSGNFNPAIILKLMETPLSKLTNPTEIEQNQNHKQIILQNMNLQTKPYVYLKRNMTNSQAYLLLAFPLFDLYDNNYKEIDCISHILTSGLSSRLYLALRNKKGITYSSNSFPLLYTDAGVFIIQATMHPDEFIVGLKTILTELKKLKNDLVEKDELTKVKNMLETNALFSTYKPIDYLTYFGLNFLDDRNFKPNIKEGIKKIRLIDANKVQSVANEIFVKSKINIFMYGNIPQSNFDFVKL